MFSKQKSKRKTKSSSKIYMPPKPKMGTLVRTGANTYEAQVGGKPKADWSEIDVPPVDINYNSYLLRAFSSEHADAQAFRQQGIDTKLTLTTNFNTWGTELFEKAELVGMDTELYLPSPRDPTKMINAALQASQFSSIKLAEAMIAPQVAKYDLYDKANDFDLVQCIYNSISTDLRRRLCLQQPKGEDEPAPIALIRLAHMHHKFDRSLCKARIEALHPSKYEGQDIIKMNVEALEIARDLEFADAYHPDITVKHVRNLLQAGGENSADNPGRVHFVRRLSKVERKLEKALKASSHLSPAEQAAYFAKKELTIQDICIKADAIYLELYHEGKWRPAQQPRQSTAPRRGYGGYVAEVNGGASTAVAKNDNCYICGGVGHYARACPYSKQADKFGKTETDQGGHQQGKGKGNGNGRNNTGNNAGRRTNGRSQRANNKHNTSPRRMYKGKSYSWCAHCNRWSKRHGTASHSNDRAPVSTLPHSQEHSASPQSNFGWVQDLDSWFPPFPHAYAAKIQVI
ncbi:hypothetical protein MPSEU_000305100 [Mayamaea pseudoterrestris]|nr:hypothetical protein MPSEU_000305100 [Mayamaea pseudoterrestris]